MARARPPGGTAFRRDPPELGQVLLAGQDITRAQPAVRTRLGLVRTFQLTNLFADMTVIENLYLAVGQRHSIGFDMLHAAGRRGNVLGEVQALLDRIGMGDYAQRKVSELAYGHQRLVEIAMALALEPRVLLLDEPAAGIPTGELAVLIDVIEQLDPAITVLIIEHDMELVRRVAREATVLVAGRVLLEGAIGAVMASDEVHRVYLGRGAGTRKAAERIDAVG